MEGQSPSVEEIQDQELEQENVPAQVEAIIASAEIQNQSEAVRYELSLSDPSPWDLGQTI